MTVAKEDQELVDSLRAKYSTIQLKHSQEREDEIAGPTRFENIGDGHRKEPLRNCAPASKSNVDVTLCPQCQGQGSIDESYGYRRLQKFCEHCDGQGVIVNKEKPMGSACDRIQSSLPPSISADEKVREKIRKLEAEVESISSRVDAYQVEKSEIGERIWNLDPKDAQQGELLQDLINQLDVATLKMQTLHAKKLDQLKRLQAKELVEKETINNGC